MDSAMSEAEYKSLDDFTGALELLVQFYKEAGSANFGFRLDMNSLSQTVLLLAADKDMSFLEVAKIDGKVCGIICGAIERNPTDYTQLIGCERYWYVSKEARSKGIGDKLINHFEDFCKSRGCSIVSMVSLPHIESRARKHYEDNGYHTLEMTWIKKLEADNG